MTKLITATATPIIIPEIIFDEKTRITKFERDNSLSPLGVWPPHLTAATFC